MKHPKELSHDELASAMHRIQRILWADGDPDYEWDAETIDLVAGVLHDVGLGFDPDPAFRDEAPPLEEKDAQCIDPACISAGTYHDHSEE
jgi:hypothetical protein